MKHKNYDSNCGGYLICQNCDMLICYSDASEKELDEMMNGECNEGDTPENVTAFALMPEGGEPR